MGGCVSLFFLFFFSTSKNINDKGGICVRRDVTYELGLDVLLIGKFISK